MEVIRLITEKDMANKEISPELIRKYNQFYVKRTPLLIDAVEKAIAKLYENTGIDYSFIDNTKNGFRKVNLEQLN